MIERSGKIEAIFEGCHVLRSRDPYLSFWGRRAGAARVGRQIMNRCGEIVKLIIILNENGNLLSPHKFLLLAWKTNTRHLLQPPSVLVPGLHRPQGGWT
jgi:hypothetical protein